MADQVRCALPDSGELGVELVPASVVIVDQVPGVAGQHHRPQPRRLRRRSPRGKGLGRHHAPGVPGTAPCARGHSCRRMVTESPGVLTEREDANMRDRVIPDGTYTVTCPGGQLTMDGPDLVLTHSASLKTPTIP